MASTTSEYKNFKAVNKCSTKDIKGLLETITLEKILVEPGTDGKFALNFKKSEIGITVSILAAIIILFVIMILLSKYIPTDESGNEVQKIVGDIFFCLAVCVLLLYIAKLGIHSKIVNIYIKFKIHNSDKFKAFNAGGLSLSIFGILFLFSIR